MKHLIFDTSNLLWRVAAARGKYNNQGSVEDQAGLALHVSLNTCLKYFKKYKPDQTAMTFEGHNNWRKDYTKSDACLSKKIYKANRVRDDSMLPIFELIKSFENLIKDHTSIIYLANDRLEGDDLFAAYVQRFTALGDEVIGISGDKDFVQLLRYPNFMLINPDNDKPRTLSDVCGVDDAKFFMFEKAMRGDKGDNVFPAYPRVLKKRLLKCFSDPYEMTQILNDTWTFTDPATGDIITYKVDDLFKENKLLMDLDAQPPDIKQVMIDSLDYSINNRGRWNFFKFMQFCGKYGLNQIADNAHNFANMFGISIKKIDKPEIKSFVEY